MASMTNNTIRNVNKEVLLDFKAEAVGEDKTFGEAIAEALLLWLAQRRLMKKKRAKLSDSKPVDFWPGTERLSERVDEELYARR